MSRIIRNLTLAIGAAVLVCPVLLAAQPRQGVPPGDGRGPRPGAISHLMNARRQLDLTPRQLMQLDSLERIQYAEHQQFAARTSGDGAITVYNAKAIVGARFADRQ